MELNKVGPAEKIPANPEKNSPGRRAIDDSVTVGKKMLEPVGIVILCIVITVVWSLLLIPIIFYYLPLPQVSALVHTDVVA